LGHRQTGRTSDSTLTDCPWCIVGADNPIPAPAIPIRADVRVSTGEHEIPSRRANRIAAAFALAVSRPFSPRTSRYEPTGLASIDSAFSAADRGPMTRGHREMWGVAALSFERNDADSLSEVLVN